MPSSCMYLDLYTTGINILRYTGNAFAINVLKLVYSRLKNKGYFDAEIFCYLCESQRESLYGGISNSITGSCNKYFGQDIWNLSYSTKSNFESDLEFP